MTCAQQPAGGFLPGVPLDCLGMRTGIASETPVLSGAIRGRTGARVRPRLGIPTFANAGRRQGVPARPITITYDQ